MLFRVLGWSYVMTRSPRCVSAPGTVSRQANNGSGGFFYPS